MAQQQKVGGASKKGRQHVKHETHYRKQADRTARNKEKSWKKHLKKYPNDIVARKNIERLRGKF